MSPEERTEATRVWIEFSGPLYAEMNLIILGHRVETTRVRWADDPTDNFTLHSRSVSIASWYMMRAAKPGDRIMLKCRCDDVAGNWES